MVLRELLREASSPAAAVALALSEPFTILRAHLPHMAAPLYLSVQLPLAVLSQAVNAAFADWEAAERRAEAEGARVRARLIRQGPIRLHYEDGLLHSSLDLAVDARILPLEAGRWGAVAGLSPRQADFEIRVRFVTRLWHDPYWQLLSETTAASEWLRRPALGIGWLKVPLSALVEPFLVREVAAAADEVDRAIATAVDLPALMAETWRTLHQAIPLDETASAWLHLHPQPDPVRVSALRGNADRLEIGVALPLDPQVHWGSAPLEGSLPPLPMAVTGPDLPPDSEMPLQVHLDRGPLLARLQQPVTGDGHWWRTLSLNEPLWAEDANRLDLRLPYLLELGSRLGHRSLRGVVQVRASLEPASGAALLHLTDWEIHLVEGDAISRILFAGARRRLSRRLHREVNHALQAAIRDLLAQVRAEIQAIRPHPNLRLRGQLAQVRVHTVMTHPTGLHLTGELSGQVSLLIEALT